MEIPSRGLAGGKYSNIFTNLAHELSCVFHQETDGCPLWSPCVRYPLDRAGNELLSWQSIVDSFFCLSSEVFLSQSSPLPTACCGQ